MIKLTPEQIRTLINIVICILLVASGWIYGAWQKHELNVYQENQKQQIAKNEQLKREKEVQNDADKKFISDSYDNARVALERRVRELEAMPRGADMLMAGKERDIGAMREKTIATGRVNAASGSVSGLPFRDGFYLDALEVELQAEKLQEYITKVCN